MVDDLTVRDVMTHEFLGVSESDSVREAGSMLLEEDAPAMVVVRGSEPLGTIDDRQLIHALLQTEDNGSARVDEIMHRPPRTIPADRTVGEAATLLADGEVSTLLVTGPDGVLGVLSERDLITVVTSRLSRETDQLAAEEFEEDVEPTTKADQSVCEQCGTLKADLEQVNGMMICSDCRAI